MNAPVAWALWLMLSIWVTTATYEHPSLAGEVMANGRPYNPQDVSVAATNRYPVGTELRVCRLPLAEQEVKCIDVVVQDTGSPALTIDLSEGGFGKLGLLAEGRIPVWVIWLRSYQLGGEGHG